MKLIIKSRRDRGVTTRDIYCLRTKIPGVRVDETAVIENRAARLFDNRKTCLNCGTDHRLAAKWLVVGVFWTDVAKSEAAKIVRAAKVKAVVDRNIRNILGELLKNVIAGGI